MLDERQQVLAIEEKALRFEEGKPYVELQTATGFEHRAVEVGLSDGLMVEVLSGLADADEVKVGGEDKKKDEDGPRRRR